jgi:hypothetical protein
MQPIRKLTVTIAALAILATNALTGFANEIQLTSAAAYSSTDSMTELWYHTQGRTNFWRDIFTKTRVDYRSTANATWRTYGVDLDHYEDLNPSAQVKWIKDKTTHQMSKTGGVLSYRAITQTSWLEYNVIQYDPALTNSSSFQPPGVKVCSTVATTTQAPYFQITTTTTAKSRWIYDGRQVPGTGQYLLWARDSAGEICGDLVGATGRSQGLFVEFQAGYTGQCGDIAGIWAIYGNN